MFNEKAKWPYFFKLDITISFSYQGGHIKVFIRTLIQAAWPNVVRCWFCIYTNQSIRKHFSWPPVNYINSAVVKLSSTLDRAMPDAWLCSVWIHSPSSQKRWWAWGTLSHPFSETICAATIHIHTLCIY